MGLWLKNIEQIRSVEWSKSWLWDVKFDNGPSGFENWFPATDVEINEWTLEPFNFAGGTSTFEIPKTSTLADIKLTFIDDIHLHVEHWLNAWVNDEIFAGGSVQTIKECCRKLHVLKLKNASSKLGSPDIVEGYPKTYLVFPKGAVYYSGKSTSEVHQDTIEFVICG